MKQAKERGTYPPVDTKGARPESKIGTCPQASIFRDPFWRAALDGQRLPGEVDVPLRIAEAVAVLIGRFMGHHAPPSECKAVVALIALAAAKYELPLFQPAVALLNLRKLEAHPCTKSMSAGAQEV